MNSKLKGIHYRKLTPPFNTARELLNQRELSRAALRSYLIAFAGVFGDATGSIRKLATGSGQAVIETFGGQIVQKLARRALGPALVADLDQSLV